MRTRHRNSMSRWIGHVAAAMCILVAAGGCVPMPTQFDGETLRQARTLVVLPLADAPGADTAGSGKLVRGELVTQILGTGALQGTDLRVEQFEAKVAQLGYDNRDRYDPTVAAAVAKDMGTDLAVCGELIQYGKKQEYGGGAVLIIAGGETTTWHQVSLSMRVVRATDGKIVYTGTGWGQAREGYTQATSQACTKALAALKHFYATQEQRKRQGK